MSIPSTPNPAATTGISSASTGVRTAITVARVGDIDVALFGDRRGNVYSVDVATGKQVWRFTPDDGPRTGITGAPTLFEGRLYVPISGGDDSSAADPKYECCKGRGAIVALDAATGKTIWTTYHHSRCPPAREERHRHATVGTVRRLDLGFADDRCQEARAVCRYRRQSFRPGHGHQRCRPRDGTRHREHPLGSPTAQRRHGQRRVPLDGPVKLSGASRSRLRPRYVTPISSRWTTASACW